LLDHVRDGGSVVVSVQYVTGCTSLYHLQFTDVSEKVGAFLHVFLMNCIIKVKTDFELFFITYVTIKTQNIYILYV